MGRWRWRPSLAGAFVLLLVSVLANFPAQVTAKSMADLAVWQIVNEKRTYTGTAFAIRERHFLTNAHVIEGFVDHDSKQIVLRQQGNALELTVNYRHVALSLTYDLALFTTREAVEHVLELAGRETAIRESQHRVVGYPEGRFTITRQAEGTVDEDALSFIVPMDRPIVGGFSGSPLLDADDRVVAVFHSAAGNMADAVKLRHVHDFLDGKLQWTACQDYPTPKGCLEAAMHQTERMAEAGDVLAQVELGDRYRKRKEWNRAIGWYRRAADQGNAFAMYRLAHFYYHGQGVEKDDRRAFELMRRSARAGETGAQYNVGVYFLWGVGTPVDRELGKDWLEKAATKGDEDARTLLDKMESQSGSTTDGASEPATVMWAIKQSNVRAGPGTSYANVDLLEVGQAVRVIERIGDWFKLEPQSAQPERFVYAPLLTETRPARSSE